VGGHIHPDGVSRTRVQEVLGCRCSIGERFCAQESLLRMQKKTLSVLYG
jgi:hypothetical protein